MIEVLLPCRIPRRFLDCVLSVPDKVTASARISVLPYYKWSAREQAAAGAHISVFSYYSKYFCQNQAKSQDGSVEE